MRRLTISAVAVLIAAFGAVAQTGTTQTSTSMNHDRMFADMMVAHHEDGIRMAQMAIERAQSGELRAMAQKMIDDQRNDITRLQSLRGEGPRLSMEEMMRMHEGMHPEIAVHVGMSEAETRRDMDRLHAAGSTEFDAMFTEVMAKHHDDAIVMSQHQLEAGTNASMKDLARAIASRQGPERDQLLAMHRQMDHHETDAASATASTTESTTDTTTETSTESTRTHRMTAKD